MNASEAERWLGYAHSDFDAAQVLIGSPEHYPRQVCFLAQQAVEKALKAALVAQKIEFPFTHDLDRLRNLLPDGWGVKTAFPDLAEVTIWAVEARYPADMPEVLESDAKRAIATADEILQVIRDDITRYFEASSSD